MPVPSATDVLIRQTAVGVYFIDVYFRSGLYPWPVEKDLILGSEGAGVVEAVGSGVSNFSIGDRVAYTVPNGGYATYRLVPSKWTNDSTYRGKMYHDHGNGRKSERR